MRKQLALLASAVVVAALLFFPIRFALAFELLGNPVNSPTLGWLGPTPLAFKDCVVDVGKVNSWNCQDTSVFTEHRLGCQLWLRFFGYGDT